MQYQYLGRSGLQVSSLSLGPWLTISKHLSIKNSLDIIQPAIDQGINFFDNAERYAEGMAESVMGQVFSHFRRENLVIATKIYWGGEGINNTGLSRKHIIEGVKNSLKRLQMDYVDILFCHQFDQRTPLDEIIITMDLLIRQGLCFYWGTSSWSAEQITNACARAEALGCIAPIAEQAQYNLFHRQNVEVEYQSLYQHYGLGIAAWSPLAGGILTGKYSAGIQTNQRLSTQSRLITADFHERVLITQELAKIALELGCTTSQLALAWCLQHNSVNTLIMGASTKEQLLENLGALSVQAKLSSEVMLQINQITQPSVSLP